MVINAVFLQCSISTLTLPTTGPADIREIGCSYLTNNLYWALPHFERTQFGG